MLVRQTINLFVLAVIAILALPLTVHAAVVTRGPYLQIGTPTSIVVRWRTDVATDSRVRYGAAVGSLTQSASDAVSTTEHIVTVTGLSANTKSFYSVGTSATELAGNSSTYFWVTAPTSGTAVPTRIWALGDPGTGNSSQAAVRNAFYTFTGSTHTNLWLMLGDNAYNAGTDAEFQSNLFNIYPEMLRKSVLWPTIGNHETNQSPSPPQTIPYYQNFSFPTSGQAGGVASGTKHYYSFDYGNVHIICLDSMTESRSPTGPMATWLQNDIAATTKNWIIAFWHHPPFTHGSHNSDTETELVEMRTNILPILENGGVDLVLTGHSHSYERSYFIDGFYQVSANFNDTFRVQPGAGPYTKPSAVPTAHKGAVYICAGSSGQISGGTLDHHANVVSLNQLGSVVIDVNNLQMTVTFLRDSGATGDSFTITKSAPAIPPVPTGLTATSGNTQVALAWNASSGATSYNVKRSTVSGSGHATIASPTTNSYTNTGLTNGVTYYYVVSAVNSAGQSANSVQASATPAPPAAAGIASGTATIDATVEAAWNNATAYTLTKTGGTVSSSSDCSATWKGMWDSTNLYILADVTDDVKNNDSAQAWDDDSVEIYVDGANNKTTTYDANDRQIVCGWGDAAAVEGAGRSITGVTFAKADPTTTSYRIETKIPWSTLGVTAAASNLVGIDVHVNDDDDSGARDGKKMWQDGTDQAWGNPSLFGTGQLLPGGSAPPVPTGLAATAGNTQVALTWNASTGATAYDVKRSTVSGSGYAVVSSPTGTSYTNTGLTNGTTYYYVVAAKNASGSSANSGQVSARPYAVAIAAGTATIDGTIEAAWSSATAYSMTKVIAGTAPGASDCSGTFKAMWDATNLYVLFQITDDLKRNDSTAPWDDDCVEVFMDGNYSHGTTYDGVDDVQWGFGWGDAAVTEGSGPAGKTAGITFAKADPTATSYVIELKIPWSTIGGTASAGRLIGIDGHVDDDDDNGARDCALSYSDPNNTGWSNPSVFAAAELRP